MKFKTLLKYVLIWQVLITALVITSPRLLPLKISAIFLGGGVTQYLENPLLNFRSNFDGVHYVLIATHGYNYGQQAFFPLYPDIIRYLFRYFRQPVLMGSLISVIAFLLSLVFLTRLINLDYTKSVPRWTVILLLTFPVSFFLGSVYTEGLFLLLVVLSFYCARKNMWLMAGICGGLAAYTRLVGVFLFPALLVELFWQGKNRMPKLSILISRVIPLFFIPLALIIYMYYLDKTTGDPLAFYHIQTAFNQARSLHIVLPYQVFWRYIKMVLTVNHNDFLYLTIWLELITGIVFSLLAVISVFRQRPSYAVYNTLAFFLPTFTGNFVSLPRYVLILFPLFILLADFLVKHPKIRLLYLGLSGLAFVVFLSLFARGYWVS